MVNTADAGRRAYGNERNHGKKKSPEVIQCDGDGSWCACYD